MTKIATPTASATPETTFRVVKITDSLRESFKTVRSEKGLTNQAMLEFAITESLPALVDALTQLGFRRTVGNTRPARLPFSDGLLAFLKESSEKLGIPAQTLLLLSIAQQCPELATEAPAKKLKPDMTVKKGRAAKAVPVAKKATRKAKK